MIRHSTVKSKIPAIIWLSGLVTALFVGCFKSDQDGPAGTEVENEVTGRLYLAGGGPAVGAKVRMYPVDFRPLPGSSDTAEYYAALTDRKGEYRIKVLKTGEYNVLGKLDDLASFRDSVLVSPTTRLLPPDTLTATGSMSGFVALQPNHLPSTATVEILGTRQFANVDDSGAFWFAGLAAGRYSIRVSTTLAEYTPLYASFAVREATAEILADTLRLTYTGIPVVTGIAAAFDTLRGVVNLSWTPVRYRNLEEYLVYRDDADALNPSTQAIGSSRDTVYSDFVGPLLSGSFGSAKSARAFRYRVRVRNKSDQVGLNFGSLEVRTPSASEVTTSTKLTLTRFDWVPTLQADSVTVRVELRNETRRLVSIAWALGNRDSVVATRPLSGGAAADSLIFAWTRPGSFRVHIRVRDDAGTDWHDSTDIRGNTGPSIRPGTIASSTIKAGLLFRYLPAAADDDEDSLRFSAKNLPAWATLDSATGLVKGIPSNIQAGTYSGLEISVSDGRRTATLPAMQLIVETSPWTGSAMVGIVDPIVISMNKTFLVISRGSKYHIDDGEQFGTTVSGWDLLSYDPALDLWKNLSFVLERSLRSAFADGFEPTIRAAYPLDGQLIVIADTWNGIRPFLVDPATGQVNAGAPAPRLRRSYMLSFLGGRVYLLGGIRESEYLNSMDEYDPTADVWAARKPVPYFVHDAATATSGGELFLFGGRHGGDIPDSSSSYAPATDTWTIRARVKIKLRGWGMGGCSAKGKVYAFAGNILGPATTEISSNILQEYDPASDTWTTRTSSSLDRSARRATCGEANGKLYFFGGATYKANGSVDYHDIVEEYDPEWDR